MTKMNPEIKAQWIEALLSGKYEQGRSYLNREGRFCCLGVLCELAVEAGVAWREKVSFPPRAAVLPPDMSDVFRYMTPEDGNGATGFLPKDIQKWAGISDGSASFRMRAELEDDSLVSLNDGGSTFEEIAKVIEKHF